MTNPFAWDAPAPKPKEPVPTRIGPCPGCEDDDPRELTEHEFYKGDWYCEVCHEEGQSSGEVNGIEYYDLELWEAVREGAVPVKS